MLVSPVRARPAAEDGHRRRILQVAIPVAALVLTAGAGLLGRVTAPADARPEARVVARAPAVPARPSATRRPEPEPPSVPTFAHRLPVRTVPDVIAHLGGGAPPPGLIAVSGSVAIDSRVLSCDRAASIADSMCERTGLLVEADRAIGALDGRATESPLTRRIAGFSSIAIRVPIGVPLPTALVWAAAVEGAVQPMSIIALGRFEGSSERGCGVGGSPCVPALIVERVAWAGDTWSQAGVVRSASIAAARAAERGPAQRTIAFRESDRDEPVLGRALLTVDDLWRVDPEAARVIPDGVDGPVWYVRSVARPVERGGPRGVGWTVVDHDSGLILAYGASPPPT